MTTVCFFLSIAALTGPPAPESGLSLFADAAFQRGFLLSHASTAKGRQVEKRLPGRLPGREPVWRLCQWATRYSLADAERTLLPGGDVMYENAGKKVVMAGPDSPNRDLVLHMKAGREYLCPRRSGESWPHLLVEQDTPHVVTLDRLEKLRLRISLKLCAFKDHMGEAADPRLHAAQCQLFFIVKHVKGMTGRKGDYFWFGVPFFDNRHELPGAYRARDAGKSDATGKFIYTIAGKHHLQRSLRDGRWQHVDMDLLPFIRAGLACAGERGYLKDVAPAHYAVVNMNLGWEMPGTYDGAVQIKDFDVKAMVRHATDTK